MTTASEPGRAPARTIRFDGWVLRLDSGDLARDGRRIRLQEQPLQILEELLRHPGELVTREQVRFIVPIDPQYRHAAQQLRALEFEPYCHDVAAVFYQDVEASFAWNGIVIRAGIDNLADVYPPFLSGGGDANTNPPTYRVLGRTYFLELRVRL